LYEDIETSVKAALDEEAAKR